MKIAEIRNASVSFGDMPLLTGISLTVEKGESYGLLGPANSGKTVLSRLLSGLIEEKNDLVYFRGKALNTLDNDKKRKICSVPSDLSFFEDLSPARNLRFFAALLGLKRREAKEAVGKTLTFCGLEKTARKPAGRLSTADKRILNIACGLVCSPELIVIDQQTRGLLPGERQDVVDLIRKISGTDTTVFYISSNADEIEACCRKIGILAYGKLVAQGTAAELRADVRDRSLAIIRPESMDTIKTEEIMDIRGVKSAVIKMDKVHVEYSDGQGCIEALVAWFAKKKTAITGIETKTTGLAQVYEALLGEPPEVEKTIHAVP